MSWSIFFERHFVEGHYFEGHFVEGHYVEGHFAKGYFVRGILSRGILSRGILLKGILSFNIWSCRILSHRIIFCVILLFVTYSQISMPSLVIWPFVNVILTFLSYFNFWETIFNENRHADIKKATYKAIGLRPGTCTIKLRICNLWKFDELFSKLESLIVSRKHTILYKPTSLLRNAKITNPQDF